MEIRNRIKALEYIHTRDLVAHPGNWREHPKAQADALLGVLKEVGIAGALLAYRSERQGGALVVIDGHLRKDAAPQKWPVLVLDVNDEEADYLLATHDPLAAMATADAGALDALLSSVQSGEAGVQAMLAELAESAGLYQPQDADPQDADPQIDRAEELRVKWGVESGQLWRLPSRTPGQEHRLICGDCTDAAVVERAMGGEKADMVFTDPPYNLAGEAPLIAANAIRDSYGALKDSEWDRGFIVGPFLSALPLADSYSIYICTSQFLAGGVWAWMANNSDFHNVVVWCKDNPMPSLSKRHWTWGTELIAYATKGKHVFNFPPTGHALNWWQIKGKAHLTEHPTEKPVEIPTRAIAHSSDAGAFVFDGFSGSGTTIIAAENLSRQCRAVELSPGYVAVALQRYVDAFGIEPELID